MQIFVHARYSFHNDPFFNVPYLSIIRTYRAMESERPVKSTMFSRTSVGQHEFSISLASPREARDVGARCSAANNETQLAHNAAVAGRNAGVAYII